MTCDRLLERLQPRGKVIAADLFRRVCFVVVVGVVFFLHNAAFIGNTSIQSIAELLLMCVCVCFFSFFFVFLSHNSPAPAHHNVDPTNGLRAAFGRWRHGSVTETTAEFSRGIGGSLASAILLVRVLGRKSGGRRGFPSC